MKKYILVLLVSLFVIPTIVLAAETCDNSKIVISSIEFDKKSDGAKELSTPSIEDKKINVDIKFKEVNDYINYKFNVKNESEEDYEIDNNSVKSNSDYIDYELIFDDNSGVIKAGQQKNVTLRVSYNKEVDSTKFLEGTYTEDKSLTFSLSNDVKVENIEKANPETGINVALIALLFIVFIIASIVLIKKDISVKTYTAILLAVLLVPLSVKALCKCEVEVNSKIEIDIPNNLACVQLAHSHCSGDGDYRIVYMQYEPGMKLSEFFTKERFSFFYSERELEELIGHEAYLYGNPYLICSEDIINKYYNDEISYEEFKNLCFSNTENITVHNSEKGCYTFGWLDALC